MWVEAVGHVAADKALISSREKSPVCDCDDGVEDEEVDAGAAEGCCGRSRGRMLQ